jgi:hypothetical protein
LLTGSNGLVVGRTHGAGLQIVRHWVLCFNAADPRRVRARAAIINLGPQVLIGITQSPRHVAQTNS